MKQLHVFSVFGTASGFFDGQFRYLHEQGNDIYLICSNAEDTEAFCERNHVHFYPVEISRSISPIADIKAINEVKKFIVKNNIDVVFGHTPKGALVAMTAAKLAGVKKRIYYRHGVIYTTAKGLKRLVLKLEEQLVSALSTKIINVSHSLSRLALKDHLNKDRKQYVIGRGTCGGIDAEKLFNPASLDTERLESLRHTLNLDKADVVFGFCGRICNDKGVPELVDAFEIFQKTHQGLNARLLLIGRFDVRDGVSDVVRKKIENNENIVLTGRVGKQDIPYYYSLLDVFVFPSHREGFGMCVLEASAMEKPILVSHAHGCEDSIIENETGLYIPLNAEGICDGMGKMLNEDLRKRLGTAGREMVVEYYDYSVMWPAVKKLYDEILKK